MKCVLNLKLKGKQKWYTKQGGTSTKALLLLFKTSAAMKRTYSYLHPYLQRMEQPVRKRRNQKFSVSVGFKKFIRRTNKNDHDINFSECYLN